MLFKKSTFAALIVSIFSVISLNALPGVYQTISDTSGEFVYYKDNSFTRTSYVGVIYYDESTYGIRYYAPADENNPKEKDIAIYFTVDPTKKYIDMTGEKIIGDKYEYESEIINYLHDCVYEFTSRRQKEGNIGIEKVSQQDFMQFGGDVKISFDSTVPVFNIKGINSLDDKPLLTLVTSGVVSNAEFNSFAEFKGLPSKIEKSKGEFKTNKKAKTNKVEFKKTEAHVQKINLDDQWTPAAENFYQLSDNAMLVLDIIGCPAERQTEVLNSLKRKCLMGNSDAYPDLQNIKVETKGNTFKATNIFFNAESKTFTKDYKIITTLKDGSIGILTLSVYYGAYANNAKYFDKIVNSYSVK